MFNSRLKLLVTTALACLLLLSAISLPLQGQAQPGRYKASRLLTVSAHASLQRHRARRAAARRSRAVITGRSYINVDGERVPSPRHSRSVPAGATAQCGDGTYSFSRHRRGTCSRHGGVARWL
jgi:hypothetical protein